LPSQHRNDVKIDLVLLEQGNALHGGCTGAFAVSRFAMGVMDKGWAIETDTDVQVVFPNKIAPFLINQSAIRLDSMRDMAMI